MEEREARKLLPKAETNVQGFMIPKTARQLDKLLNSTDIRSIHDLEQGYLGSGSKLTEKQFLALRIVYPELLSYEAILGYLISISVTNVDVGHQFYPGSFKPLKRAQEQIRDVADMTKISSTDRTAQNLEGGVSVDESVPTGHIGTLRRTLRKRKTVFQRRPTTSDVFQEGTVSHEMDESYVDSAKSEARDEATPNAALILLMQGMSDSVKNSKIEWTFDHAHFKLKFAKGDFNVWTDGALQFISNQKTIAIAEAKKRQRQSKMTEILMQEGAEVARWLLTDRRRFSAFNGHRVLISQIFRDIYITFASYHDEYLDYLLGNSGVKANAFLRMQTYGPFCILYHEDMQALAIVMTAITLVAKEHIW